MSLQINQPFTLPCGLIVPNRLSKAAMAENMAGRDHLPNNAHQTSYGAWSSGDWGMIMTGNVQIDPHYLGGPNDIAFDGTLDRAHRLKTWRAWASAIQAGGSPAIVQINHPGRQSPMGTGRKGLLSKNLAPSAVGLKLGQGLVARALSAMVFGTPREMTRRDMAEVVEGFVETARLAAEAGFRGIEVHAAHGYLLAQFLSADSNRRTDEYGGTAKGRAKIVVEIIGAIKKAVPEGFAVGIKFNSVDHQSTQALAECVEQLQLIVAAGIDFLEISGGTYEEPIILGPDTRSERTKAREAFFLDFSNAIRKQLPGVPLMVTGGFRSRKGMENAVASGACDLVGIARPAVVYPTLPKDIIFNSNITDEAAVVPLERFESPWIVKQLGLKAVGAGAETAWYGKQIGKLSAVPQKA